MGTLAGLLFLIAIPVVLVTTVLLGFVSKGSRPLMWKVTGLFAIGAAGLAAWPHIQAMRRDLPLSARPELSFSVLFFVLLFPLVTIAGVLHLTSAEEWSTKRAGALAACAGLIAFFIAAVWGWRQM